MTDSMDLIFSQLLTIQIYMHAYQVNAAVAQVL